MTFKALVVGSNYEGSLYLPDCILDAENERDMILRHVPGATVRFLTDPALDTYTAALKDFVASIGVEDVGHWYSSGHGTHKRDPREPDGWREALVCFPKPGLPTLYFWDHDVNDILAESLGPINVRLDHCFAGGATREMVERDAYFGNLPRARFVPSDDVLEPGERLHFIDHVGRAGAGVLTQAACREGELSYSTGRGGAFTLASHAKWVPGQTYRENHQATKGVLPTAAYPQHPILLGGRKARKREVFPS